MKNYALTPVTLFLLFNVTMTPLALADGGNSTDSLSVDECITQAKHYLNETKPTRIPAHCYDDYLAAVSPNAIKKTSDGQTLVFGRKNILFIQKHMIAGKHSHLKEITAIALDQVNQEVVVLDGQHGFVLPFSLKLFGNVSPRRALKSKILVGATSIVVSPNSNEFIIANNSTKSLHFFSRLADVDGHKPSSNTAQLRSIEGSLTQITSAQSLAIDSEHDELFLLDKDSNQILVFDQTASANTPPKRSIKGSSTLLSSPIAITYNQSNDTLDVVNGDGTSISYPRTAKGDISP